MAGLLNLVPATCPATAWRRDWARAVRPLVFVFTAIAFARHLVFAPSVDAQGGAYATGVLVLITSASVAVTLSARRRHRRRATVLFGIVARDLRLHHGRQHRRTPRRPADRHRCSSWPSSWSRSLSRAQRAFELRGAGISFDAAAERYLNGMLRCGTLRLIAHDPNLRDADEYRDKVRKVRGDNDIPKWAPSSSSR